MCLSTFFDSSFWIANIEKESQASEKHSLQSCMQMACIYVCLSVDLCKKPKRGISTSVFWDEFYEEVRKKTLRATRRVNCKSSGYLWSNLLQYLCLSCRNLTFSLRKPYVSAVRNVRFTYAKPKEYLCLFLFRLAGFQVFGERKKAASRIRA